MAVIRSGTEIASSLGMRKASALSILMIVLLSFFQVRQAAATLDPEARKLIIRATDFSVEGDRDVAARYERFLSGDRRCRVQGPGARVLLTGFGLFAGVPYNVSGALVENFANPEFWPDDIDTSRELPGPGPTTRLADGVLNERDNGARVLNRHLRINGHDFNVCFMVLDVLWDFAGAVVAAEMERFQPNFVLMTGRGAGTVTLEGAARNIAIGLSGFRPNGDANDLNTPISSTIDTSAGGEKTVPMTWNNQILGRRISPLVNNLGFAVTTPAGWSGGNDYICNNISFIALSSAAGYRFKLAGDLIDVHPVIRSDPRIGFMHLPTDLNLTPSTTASWARVYASLIDQAVTQHLEKRHRRPLR